MDARNVTLAGLIVEMRRRGPRVSFMLDDRSGRMEVTMFEEVYQRHRELIVKDALVQVEGRCASMSSAMPGGWPPGRCSRSTAVRERLARHAADHAGRTAAACRAALLARARGSCCAQARGGQCAVLLRYRCREASGTLSFGEEWKVRPSRELLEQLEDLLGPGAVRLSYSLETPVGSDGIGQLGLARSRCLALPGPEPVPFGPARTKRVAR